MKTSTGQQKFTYSGQKLTILGLCVLGIYLCHTLSSVLEEEIFKTEHSRHDGTGKDYFTNIWATLLFDSFFCLIFGFIGIQLFKEDTKPPHKKVILSASIDVVIHGCLITSLEKVPYIFVIMTNSSGLLAVVLIGACLSGVKNEAAIKIGWREILACIVVVSGIVLFDVFSENSGSADTDSKWSVSWLTGILLASAVLLQGFRADLQAQIKVESKMSGIRMYFYTCRALFVLSTIVCIATGSVTEVKEFIDMHPSIIWLLTFQAILYSLGKILVFVLIRNFKQHLAPLLLTVRKVLTVVISIMFFHRSINWIQAISIVLVFSGVLIEMTTKEQSSTPQYQLHEETFRRNRNDDFNNQDIYPDTVQSEDKTDRNNIPPETQGE